MTTIFGDTHRQPAAAAAESPAPEAPATPAPTTPAPSQPTPAATTADADEKKDEKKEDVKEDKKEEPAAAAEEPLPDSPDGIINMEIFSQIQDMDDEDDEDGPGSHEFSKGIVWGYFEQAEATFKQMEDAM